MWNIYIINKIERKQSKAIGQEQRESYKDLTYFKHYIIQGKAILNNRNGGLRAHEERKFKNRNVETSWRKLQNQLKKVTKIAIFIENKLEQIQDLKRKVQEAMFEDEREVEEISIWDCQ